MDTYSLVASGLLVAAAVLIAIGLALGAFFFLVVPWLWQFLSAHLHWVS